MSEMPDYKVGAVVWTDLTVPNAGEVRTFYQQVVGWDVAEMSVEDHTDFVMSAPGSETPAAGICHALGGNAGLPPQWLIYIAVEDLDKSIAACNQNGGKVIAGPKEGGGFRYCVIQDPGGAVAALMEKPAST